MRLTQRDYDKLDQIDERLDAVVELASEICKVPFCVVEGLRTLERQKELYAKGRTKPGKIVTWTLNSEHLSGRAVDLAPLNELRKIDWEDIDGFKEIMRAMKEAAKELKVDLECGGDWDKHRDYPHFQIKKGTK